MSTNVSDIEKAESAKAGKKVLFGLLAFFAVFFTVDAYFVYQALSSHTGVIEEHHYEKGLAFDKTLKAARTQKALHMLVETSYKDGMLNFTLEDQTGKPVQNAIVTAKIIRPTQDGYDFKVDLQNKGNGLYTVNPDTPLEGYWRADIEAKWDTQNEPKIYQTELNFTTP